MESEASSGGFSYDLLGNTPHPILDFFSTRQLTSAGILGPNMKYAMMKMGKKTASSQMFPRRSSRVLPENHQNENVMKIPM